MKRTLTTILTVILTVVLLAAASSLGAVRGWGNERAKVLDLISQDGELAQQLGERAMDAANLAVVAARHLPEDDADLRALYACRDTLMACADAPSLARADMELSQLASALRGRLTTLASVRESRRDQVYISTLTRALADSTSLSQTYADKAADFNRRLNASLTGKLAMLLGVKPVAAQ